VTSLHWRIIILLAWLTFFFNIERISFGGQSTISLNVGIYIVGAVAALLPLAPFALERSLFSHIVVIAVLDGIVLALSNTPVFGGVYTYITFSSLVFLMVTLALSYRVSRSTLEFRKAIETITFSDSNDRLRDLREMRTMVDTEMVRSRRFERPLSLVIVQADPASINMQMHKLVQEVQRSMMQRYVLSTMARVLSRTLRRTDLVIEDSKPGRLLLVAPETEEAQANLVGGRITRLIQERLGIAASFGTASFPQQALTFEDLLSVAESRMQSEPLMNTEQTEMGEPLELYLPRSSEFVASTEKKAPRR
jgi:hypothetical protein